MGSQLDLAKDMAKMRLPADTDKRLQELMDRNNDGMLTREEKKELRSIVAISELLSLLRAKALLVLGRKPQ